MSFVCKMPDNDMNQEIVMKMTNQKGAAWCSGLKFLLYILYKFTKDYYYQIPINYNHLPVRLGALVDHKFQRPTLLMIRSTRKLLDDENIWTPAEPGQIFSKIFIQMFTKIFHLISPVGCEAKMMTLHFDLISQKLKQKDCCV